MNAVFRPSRNLPPVVDTGCITVNAASQWRQRRHHTVLPNEPKTYMIGNCGKVGLSAAPSLVQWICIGGFGNTCDLSPVVLIGPRYRAVGASERAKIDWSADPEKGVLVHVSCFPGIACYPANIVDAGRCGNIPAARVSETKHVVPGWLLFFLLALD
jgi:hypothetical protein